MDDSIDAPRVALLHWGDLIEDFLEPIGLSFEDFRDGMTGGWMFGYVDALQRAGVETVVFCITAEVGRPEKHRHRDTGAEIWRLPASRAYLALRRHAMGTSKPQRGLQERVARQLAPYLATPLRSVARILREERCRAVLCQDYEHPRFDVCVLLGRMIGLPVFATFQGGSVQTYRLERWTRPLALRGSRGLIVAPEREAARVRGTVRARGGEDRPNSQSVRGRLLGPGWSRRSPGRARAGRVGARRRLARSSRHTRQGARCPARRLARAEGIN